MNIKFVVGGVVVIGALFLGTEIYWKKQFEQKARDDFKSLSFLKPMNDAMAKANLPLKVDALNHYPHVLVYADFTQDLPNTVNKTDNRWIFHGKCFQTPHDDTVRDD